MDPILFVSGVFVGLGMGSLLDHEAPWPISAFLFVCSGLLMWAALN